MHGTGKFSARTCSKSRRPESAGERIRFDYCIIAAGSEPRACRFSRRIRAFSIPPARWSCRRNPGRLLVIGGGIIGLEMACVYDALGAKVSVVELTSQLMPGCDPDLVRPLEKRIRARYGEILLDTQVTAVRSPRMGLQVSFAGKDGAKQRQHLRSRAGGRWPHAQRQAHRRRARRRAGR